MLPSHIRTRTQFSIIFELFPGAEQKTFLHLVCAYVLLRKCVSLCKAVGFKKKVKGYSCVNKSTLFQAVQVGISHFLPSLAPEDTESLVNLSRFISTSLSIRLGCRSAFFLVCEFLSRERLTENTLFQPKQN